jgi:lipopolysaccharide export system permease protein
MGPVLLVAAVLGAGLVYFNNRILPEANFRAAALRNDIGRKKPTALIEPRTLIKDFENYQIWIDRLDRASGAMQGVRIYGVEPGKPLRYTYADSATMEYANGGKSIVIRLKEGENHFLDHKDQDNYVRVRFKGQDVAIDNVDATLERRERSYRSDREMSTKEMLDVVKTSEARLKALREEYRGKIFEEMKALSIVLSADSIRDVPPRLLAGNWRDEHPIPALRLAEAKRQEKDRMYLVERYERREENERKENSQYMVEIHKKYSIPAAPGSSTAWPSTSSTGCA